MVHGGNERFQGCVRRDSGFLFRLAEQLDNPRPAQNSRNRRAAENNEVRFFFGEDLDAFPIVANGLLNSIGSVVFKASPVDISMTSSGTSR